MKIIKIDEQWFKAEQRIENGLLSYVVTAFSKSPVGALIKLIQKEYIKN
jgi:hypothetical protein